MRNRSENKAINLSPAAQAELERRTRVVAITHDEASEVGKRVIQAAEQRVRDADPKRIARDKAAALTPDEEKQLADAQAAYDTAAARCLELRLAAMKAERAALEVGPPGGTPERAHLELRAAEARLRDAEVDTDHHAGRLARLTGQIEARRAWSRRQHILRHGL
jgi:hypothetical protein